MTARKWHAVRDRHVRFCLLQTGGLDDLTLDPTAVGFTGDCLDREAEESEAVVRIFVPRIALDHRRLLKVSQQFVGARERATILEIPGIGTVAHDARAVRKELAHCRFCDLRMQPLDVLANRVVQAQLAGFAQFHNAGSGETLECEAIRKRWRGVSGSPAAKLADPNARSRAIWPRCMTTTMQPG